MLNDPIGDMIIQIKNAGLSGRENISLPFSKIKYQIAEILKKEGYIVNFKEIEGIPFKKLQITLRYDKQQHVITDVKRLSKPGLRVYVNRQSIPVVVGGMGIAIISTSNGLMTGKDAKKAGIGGELLCEIW